MIDFVSYQDTILHLEHITRNADTIIINKSIIDIRSIPNANLLVNDSLVMLGAMDGAVFRIKDGSLVRRMNEQPFHQSQMTGEPAVHPGSALLDSSGQYCYAWGNAIVGGSRINFRVAIGHDYLTCFPEYKVTLPENGRIARIRYFGGSKMWIKLFRKGKIEDYICNVDGTKVERVERLTFQGQDIEPNSLIGFARDKLASVVSTDTEFIIYVYHLKSE